MLCVMNSLALGKHITQVIQEQSLKVYPEEACGLIIQVADKFEAVVCENKSEKPKEDNFLITDEDFAKAEDLGEVIAVWHTHTDQSSEPSTIDIHYCNATALNWVIFSLNKREAGFEFDEPTFLFPSDQPIDYVGRPYVFGIHDCFTLVEDYYKREFSINIEHKPAGYPDIENWFEEGLNLLVNNFEINGFVQLLNREPEIGDVFIIQVGSDTPNHLAIYLGADRILHHCRGRLSTIDAYNRSYWWKHTTHHLRHRSKVID